MAKAKDSMDLEGHEGDGTEGGSQKKKRNRSRKSKQNQDGGQVYTDDMRPDSGHQNTPPRSAYTNFQRHHSGGRQRSAPHMDHRVHGGHGHVPQQHQAHHAHRGMNPAHQRSQGHLQQHGHQYHQHNSPVNWQNQQQMMDHQAFFNHNMMQNFGQDPRLQYPGPYQMQQVQCNMPGQGQGQMMEQIPQNSQKSRTPGNKKKGPLTHQDSPQGDGGKQKRTPKPQKAHFETYWSAEDVQRGLKRGELIQAPIRVNPKNFEDSYVPHPDGKSDIYICGMKNRNRALNGDVVAVLLEPRDNWKVLVEDMGPANELAKNMKKLALSGTNTEAKNKPDDGVKSGSDTDVIVEEEYYEENTDSGPKTDPPACAATDTDNATNITGGKEVTVNKDKILVEDKPKHTPQTKIEMDDGKTVTKDLDVKEAESTVDRRMSLDCQNTEVEPSASSCDNVTGSNSDLRVNSTEVESSSLTKAHSKQNEPASEEQVQNKKPRKRNKTKTPAKGQGQAKDGITQQQTGGAGTPQKKRYTSVEDYIGRKEDGTSGQGDSGVEGSQTQTVPDNMVLRTAKVVYIVEKKHSRACTGHIKLLQDKNPNQALFSPLDGRLPRILVPMTDCPQGFYERPEDHAKTLFIARITQWTETSMYAKGELARSLGEAGEIEPETEGILIEHDIDFSEFSEEAILCLPKNLPWHIPQSELESRRDLRQECIFTIDPATARDLDDALSCKPLGNGRYEVGVHIADVSYFVEPENELDSVAASRATSVYMVQKVIPMLPRLLCEELCSLNPDKDRLTFSVIWTITEDGVIEEEWFGRTVIRSCVKMSYEHAQGMIEAPQREWTVEELPPISEGFSISQIRDIVLLLNKSAQNLRQKRYDNGALRLDQVKLQYTLDKETGLPCGYSVFKQRESNKLVEEFMLLANMAVARRIYSHYPEISVLRRHPPPQTRMIDELSSICRQLGIPLDVTNSRTIQQSLAAFATDNMDDQAKLQILTVLCSKPMQNARYFCTGVLDDEEDYRHYALNVPFYTHFTSPIRRYPDIMVHRLLAASLNYCEAPRAAKGEVQKESEHCNDRKTAAKRASELSSEIFFAVFVKECGPLEERGMVMAVLDKAFDVLILKLGVVKRVYCEKLPLTKYSYRKDKKAPLLTLVWKADDSHPTEVTQVIGIFSHVCCQLSADEQPLKWMAVVKHPSDVDV